MKRYRVNNHLEKRIGQCCEYQFASIVEDENGEWVKVEDVYNFFFSGLISDLEFIDKAKKFAPPDWEATNKARKEIRKLNSPIRVISVIDGDRIECGDCGELLMKKKGVAYEIKCKNRTDGEYCNALNSVTVM